MGEKMYTTQELRAKLREARKEEKAKYLKKLSEMDIWSIYPMNVVKEFFDSRNIPMLEDAFYCADFIQDIIENRLTEREKIILEDRKRDGLSLKATSEKHGVTAERIRQIEAKALRKVAYNLVYAQCVRRSEYEALLAENAQLKMELAAYNGPLVLTDQEKIDLTMLEDIGLSVRAYNCLKRSGRQVIGDLRGMSFEDLAKIRNLGKKTAKEIETKVRHYGIYFPHVIDN